MNPDVSIIIIAGNEQDVVSKCLISCAFAPEIILVTNSTDKTIEIAKKTNPKVIVHKLNIPLDKFDFAKARNKGFELAHHKWVFYVDCDEVVTQSLKNEIITKIKNDRYTNYDIPRENYFLNHRVKFGGTYPDYVKRLFRRDSFKGYVGVVHEQPQITGEKSVLANNLLHFTHRNISSMLEKSLKWTEIEAGLLYESHHPPVVWWRFIRMMLTKFINRLVVQQMWRDGVVGWISVIFETFDTFIIYARLWELQQHES